MVVLVGYASAHGSTRGIATRVATRLREQGFEVDARPVDEAGPADGYEALVIGSAVHNGDWLDEAAAFLQDNARGLAERPVWLFSVGLARVIGGRFEARAKPPRRVAAFLGTADRCEHHLFAGRIERGDLAAAGPDPVEGVRRPLRGLPGLGRGRRLGRRHRPCPTPCLTIFFARPEAGGAPDAPGPSSRWTAPCVGHGPGRANSGGGSARPG